MSRAAYISPQLAFSFVKAMGYTQRYARVLRMLKQRGHSVPKAIEVIIDAARGGVD